MKMQLVTALASIGLLAAGCKKDKDGGASTGSAAAGSAAAGSAAAGSAAEPVADVSCQDASKAYAKVMAASPGNPFSDMKPEPGLVHLFAVTIEEGCDAMWSPRTRACMVKLTSSAGVAGCFDSAEEAAGLDAGVAAIVAEFKVNKANNDKAAAAGAAEAGGSAAGSGGE